MDENALNNGCVNCERLYLDTETGVKCGMMNIRLNIVPWSFRLCDAVREMAVYFSKADEENIKDFVRVFLAWANGNKEVK